MISDTQLARFQAIVEAEIGLSFLPQKSRDLEKAFEELLKNSSFSDPRDYLHWLERAEQKDAKRALLARQLTIGETFFLRDKNLFQVLQDQILGKWLPETFSDQKSLRIWSAGCSTGEEAYSLAIILDSLHHIYKNWQVSILGTDINKAFLDKAQRGAYTLWSFRQTPQEIINKYFSKQGDNLYTISDKLKEKVSFFELNLADFSAYPGAANKTSAVQVILCRNVLMYLAAETRRRVISRLASCLLPGGWLLVSPGEVHLINQADLKAEQYPGVTLFRKQAQGLKEKSGPKESKSSVYAAKIAARKETRPEKRKERIPGRAQSAANEDRQAWQQEVYNRAWKYYEQGQYSDGIYELSRLLSIADPQKERFLLFSESLALMARLKANSGQKEEALKFSLRAIEKEKLNPELYYLKAAIKQEMGQIQEAIQALQQVLYLDRDCIMAAFNLGLLLRREGKQRLAYKHFYNVLHLLESMQDKETVHLSEGLTVKQLREMVRSLLERGH